MSDGIRDSEFNDKNVFDFEAMNKVLDEVLKNETNKNLTEKQLSEMIRKDIGEIVSQLSPFRVYNFLDELETYCNVYKNNYLKERTK